MELGLHLADFTYPRGAAHLGEDLARVARLAEEAGFDRLSVMDHVWQITFIGAPEREMLEAYTTLGYLAGSTERVQLMTLVTGAVYRAPALVAKMVTTLDVLSGGRAALGIGAAWNGEESAGLGLDFPPVAERFERLEEAIQICLQMWSGDESAYSGRHYQLGRTLSSPQPIRKPRPPILIGGGGEKKTLRLVAQYADACNLTAGPELDHKLAVLRSHCERLGRDYDEIQKTVGYRFELGADGAGLEKVLEDLGSLGDKGVSVVYSFGAATGIEALIDAVGSHLVPALGR